MGELTPEQMEAWRQRPLGAITESVEVEAVLDLAGALHGRRVLDVGTGDGTHALAAARLGAFVVGVDSSQAMLAAARRRTSREGLAIEWQLGDALQLPFPEASFDLVLSVTMLCFVRDGARARAIAEMWRVLRPGGRLVLAELGP